MKTLNQIACNMHKSVMVREMAKIRSYCKSKKKAIKMHSEQMNIDISESEQYYQSVSDAMYE